MRRVAAAVPWDTDTLASVWEAHWDWALRAYHGDTGPCPACGADALALADGLHCTTCSTYVRVGAPPGGLRAPTPTAKQAASMTKVLIAGYYGAGNLGDEAILSCMLQELGKAIPDFEASVVSTDPADTTHRHGIPSVGYQDIPGLIAAARDSNLVILGGGGLFHDYWDVDPGTVLTPQQSGLAYYAGIPLLARLVGVPCMIYAVGVGPLRTEESRRLTAMAFELASVASVRDALSLDLVALVDKLSERARRRISLSSDPAFLIQLDEGHGCCGPSGSAWRRTRTAGSWLWCRVLGTWWLAGRMAGGGCRRNSIAC